MPQTDEAAPVAAPSESSLDGFSPSTEAPGADAGAAPVAPDQVNEGEPSEPPLIPWWAWIAGLSALLLAGLAALFLKRRSTRVPARLVASEPLAEAEAAPAPLARLEIGLEIVSATRSLMMFTLEYRLTFTNRSDRAVRDLAVSAQLASARSDVAVAGTNAGGRQVGTIERIGPHQTRSLSGQMQLPLADIRAILQGRKPIFVPLLHLMLESPGQEPLNRSYVVGTPSAASQGRLHPIPLDTPPGGVPGLKAREVSLAA